MILEVSAIGFVASFFDWKIFIVIFFASFVNYGINQFSSITDVNMNSQIDMSSSGR